MRILHFSDLHGRHTSAVGHLIARHEPDWVVLTGDILPDFHMISGKGNRLACQREWWGTYRSCFLRTGTVTTLTLGNHEIEGFQDAALSRIPSAIEGKVGTLEGNPAEFGAWGFSREFGPEALRAEVEALNRPLVVLSHCPPNGLLDRTRDGSHIGHPPLRDYLDKAPEAPLLVLCGHVHESFGQVRRGRTLVVNAATGFALLDLDLFRGQARVLEMARLNDALCEVP